MSVRDRAFTIPVERYNHMIGVPGMRKHLLRRRGTRQGEDECSFIGTNEEYLDFLKASMYWNDNAC